MKKIGIIFSIVSLLVLQSWAASSISEKLKTYQANQPKPLDKAGKVIVACICEDIFPALKEAVEENKADIKTLMSIQLQSMNLTKEQLHQTKLMVHDAANIISESVHVGNPIIKKLGKNIIDLAVRYTVTDVAKNSIEQDILSTVASSVTPAQAAQIEALNVKLQNFGEKWKVVLSNVEQAITLNVKNKNFITVEFQEVLNQVLINVLSQERVVRMQKVLDPILPMIKTQEDVVNLMQSCVRELEFKFPDLINSFEKCVEDLVPLLESIITESIDETVHTVSA